LHAAPNDWAELERELVALAASGAVEVREDGEWLAELTGLHCEVHHQGKNPLIHLWSDERNLTRRLLRVKEWNPDRILLEVQRFGKAKPGQLEFLLRDNSRSAGRITREQFRARFARILAEKFPDSIVDSLTSSPDLEHSFSGLYVRGTMHEGRNGWALLAAGPSEADSVEDMLAFGILWLDWSRNRSEKRGIEGLRLFVPEGTSRSLRERTLGLSNTAKVEIFEMREPDVVIQRVDAADAGNLESYLAPRPEIENTIAKASEAAQRIRGMLPQNPLRSPCACHPNPAQLRFVFAASNLRAELMRGLFLAWENRSKD
jgi:hypothetical protein